MNLENAFELEIPNGDVKHIAKDGTVKERFAPTKTPAELEAFITKELEA